MLQKSCIRFKKLKSVDLEVNVTVIKLVKQKRKQQIELPYHMYNRFIYFCFERIKTILRILSYKCVFEPRLWGHIKTIDYRVQSEN